MKLLIISLIINTFSDMLAILTAICLKIFGLDNNQYIINYLNISIIYIKWYVYCWCVYIPIIGLQHVNIGLASDFFHMREYTTHMDKSMEHLCSFRTLTPFSASVYKMHFQDW